MDDGSFFSLNSSMAETPMDLDYMDELLLEGCWLETAAGSNFLHSSSPLSSSFFDPSFSWSTNIESTNNNEESSINPIQHSSSTSYYSLPDNLPTQWLTAQNPTPDISDPTRRLWIGPRSNNNTGSPVMDRLIQALNYIKESSRNKDALIQVWIPVNSGGKRVLSTSNQPFSLDLNIPSLASYREISMNYQFPTDGNSNQQIEGLPGRVFKDKVPEWTPDVRFFSNNEYARVNDAQRFGVRGTLAVPVFEQGSRSCLGVIEVVTTAQTTNYRPELESVCRALEAVHLRTTSEVSVSDNANAVEASNGNYEDALPEILRVLESACGTHKLPLAQTWVSCVQQGKGGCRHSDENYARCVSTVDSACYVADASFRGFLEACSEHHLLKGQGVAGRAFTTNQPCFSPNVTSFSKTEYPLSHHARMFGLRAAVAIRLRSVNTGSSDFVLEFFLPKNCVDPEEQKELLTSLSSIIQNVCWSLRVVTDKEIEEDEESGGDEEEETLPVDKFVIEENTATNKAAGSGGGGDRRRTKSEKAITLQMLQQYFSGSLKDAARKIGVCPTTLKRICRQHGITRWPSRKLKKVGHSLQKLQHVIDSVQGTSGTLQIGSFYSSFPALASPNVSRTSPFVTSNNPVDEQQQKQSSSGTHSSTSSQCYSTASQPKLAVGHENTTVKKETSGSGGGSSLKRVRSEAGMNVSNDGDHYRNKFLPRSHSHKLLNDGFEGVQPVVVAVVPDVKDPPPPPRIKVAFGEDKIRFRLQSHWKYKDLTREIDRRFGLEDGNGFHLKYLDDDFEWVLLTCDADLQECVDVSRSSLGDTIKLSLVRISS